MEHNDGLIQHVQVIVDSIVDDIKKKASPEFCEILETIPIRVLWESPEKDRYGDFFGVPLDEGDGANMAPSDIILYAAPLLEHSHHKQDELQAMVKKTLMHEVGHYLGLNHGELKERGLD